MPRILDHIDLRVSDLGVAKDFYAQLLPALGFTEPQDIPGWESSNAAGLEPTEFFGFTESAGHCPNENRIAFWAESNADVDALVPLLVKIDAQNIEGPLYEEEGYYAVFFEDPFGNRFELCHRKRN